MADDIQSTFSLDISDLTAGLENATSQVRNSSEQMEGSFEGIGEAASGIKSSIDNLLEFTGIALAIDALDGLKNKMEAIAEAGTHIVHSASLMGISTTEFQGLELAADKAGVSFQKVEMATLRLDLALTKAREGNTSMIEKMKASGVTAEELANIHYRGADALVTFGQHTDKVGAQLQLLGPRNREALIAAKALAGGMDEAAHAAMMHGAASEAQLKQLEELHSAFAVLGFEVKNYGMALVASLAPAAETVIDEFSRMLSYFSDLASFASDKLTPVIEYMRASFADLFGTTDDGDSIIGKLVQWWGELWGTLGFGRTVIEAIAEVFRGFWDLEIAIWTTVRDLSAAFNEQFQVVGVVREAWADFGEGLSVGQFLLKTIHDTFVTLQIVVYSFGYAIQTIGSYIVEGVQLWAVNFARMAETADRALHFDFSGAKAAWQAGTDQINEIINQGTKDRLEAEEKFDSQLDVISARESARRIQKEGEAQVQAGEAKVTEAYAIAGRMADAAHGDATKIIAAQQVVLDANRTQQNLKLQIAYETAGRMVDAAKGEASVVAEAQQIIISALNERKAVEDSLKAPEKQKEHEGIKTPDLGTKEDPELELMKLRLSETRKGSEERVQLASQIAAREIELGKGTMKEWIAAIKGILAAKKEEFDESVKLDVEEAKSKEKLRLDRLSAEQKAADEEYKQKRISGEEYLAASEHIILERLKAELALQDALAAAAGDDPAKYKAAQDAKVLATQKAGEQIVAIDRKVADEAEKALMPIGSMFGKMMDDMIAKHMTFANAVRTLEQSLMRDVLHGLEQWAAKFIADELKKTGILQLETAARKAINNLFHIDDAAGADAASAAKIAAAKAEAVATIPAEAAVAAGGAAAAMASIPYVGPVLAAAAYAETFALVMSGLGFAGAAQGAVLPEDMLISAHKDEMILPPNLSKGMQNVIERGDVGSAGGDSGGSAQSQPIFSPNLHVHAIDSAGVKALFKREGGAIMKALHTQFMRFNSPYHEARQ